MDRARANSAWRMMTFLAEVTLVDNVYVVYFRGCAPDTRYYDDGPGKSASASLDVKQGILTADATSEELPCAVLPEFASAKNVADAIELRKQNAGCVNGV